MIEILNCFLNDLFSDQAVMTYTCRCLAPFHDL
jgi:hypothetical protein